MASPLTLAQMRDNIRRYLMIVPYIDYPTPGPVGAVPPQQPDPNNATINQAINEGISSINRAVRIGSITKATIPVPLPQITDRGIQFIDYSNYITNALTATEITNVWFSDGFVTQRLERYDYYSKDRDYTAEQMYPPGPPIQFTLTGAQIGILPPSATSGNLWIQYAGSIPQLVNDNDTVQFLPIDYQNTLIYAAVALLSARQATDIEAAQRYTDFLPMWQNGIVQTYAWKNGYDREAIQTLRDTLTMIPLAAALKAIAAAQTLSNETGQSPPQGAQGQ